MGTKKTPFIMRKIFTDLGIMNELNIVEERELYRLVMPSTKDSEHEIDITLPANVKALK